VQSVAVACPNVRAIVNQIEYPGRAKRAGVNKGSVQLKFVLGPNGEIKNTSVVNSSNAMFNEAALDGARLLKCNGQGREVTVLWEVGFRLD
jgi:TonB family protein